MRQPEHPSWEEELMAYADGELQTDQAERVALHLQSCSECAGAVAEAKKLSAQMAVWQVEEAPSKLSESVAFELQKTAGRRRETRSGSGWWTRGRVWTYGVAGTFAAVMLVAFALTPSLLRSRQSATESHADLQELQLDQSQQGQEGQGQQGDSMESAISPKRREAQQRAPGSSQSSTGPMVIRMIRLTLITKEFDKARTKIETTVQDARGYVDQMTVRSNPGAAKSLVAVLRFPSDSLDAELAELRKLGQAKEESQNTSDVTGQYTDLVARLTNARNTEQRMLALQRERTGKLPEVVEVEREIGRIREEIERMEAEQKNLNNKVQYATVHVDLTEEYHAQLEPSAPSAGTRLRNAAVEGYAGAKETGLGMLLWALMYGPTLVLWALILAPLGFLVWTMQKRTVRN